ncbi:hypothetical protein NMY22_g1541 [Coprinellus aureogranulatus]|nr:hypothetical protein NMY22_g1541 [Coprinellus aureogranulatus]
MASSSSLRMLSSSLKKAHVPVCPSRFGTRHVHQRRGLGERFYSLQTEARLVVVPHTVPHIDLTQHHDNTAPILRPMSHPRSFCVPGYLRELLLPSKLTLVAS